MMGFLLPPASRGTWRPFSRSRKRQMRRRRTQDPSRFVALCPALLPFASVPEASPTVLAFPPVVLTGTSTDGIPFALSLQGISFVLPFPQVASLPLGHSSGSSGFPFPVFFIPVGLTPKYEKSHCNSNK
uniref:Uncharacterized protein n=1 Tax=Pan troglodytes TaxID=9598 RepID=A0A2I3TU38_PANTR